MTPKLEEGDALAPGALYWTRSVFLEIMRMSEDEITYRTRDFGSRYTGPEREIDRGDFEEMVADGLIIRAGWLVR